MANLLKYIFLLLCPAGFKIDCLDGQVLQSNYAPVYAPAYSTPAYAPVYGSSAYAPVYGSSTTAGVCVDCPPGTSSQSGLECTPCVTGTYADKSKSNLCMPCPSGTISIKHSYGTYGSYPGGDSFGTSGNAFGVYGDSSGSYGDSSGILGIYPASSGSRPAAYGAYGDSINYSHYSAWKESVHVWGDSSMPEYLFGVDEGNACAKCPIGYYQPGIAGQVCIPCDPGEERIGIGVNTKNDP